MLLGGILLGVILTIGVLWWALAGGDETPAIEVIIELVDGPEDVVVLIDDPLAEELQAFYGRWAGLLNREEFSEAFELYSPAFRAETSLEEWSSAWETVGIAELLVTQVETDADGVVFSSIEYVTESVDDNAVDPCLVWHVEHSLVPGEDDLRVAERAELTAPRPC